MTPKEKQKYHQMSVGGELKLSPDFQKNGEILWQYWKGLVDFRMFPPFRSIPSKAAFQGLLIIDFICLLKIH